MSTRTLPQPATGTRGLRLELRAPASPGERSAPGAGWRWQAMSDGVTALVVLCLASVLVPRAQAVGRTVADQALFVLVCWVALAVGLFTKRLYPRARRRIAPALADEFFMLEGAIAIGALTTLALAALVPLLRQGPLDPGPVAAAFGSCAVALPLARAAVTGLRGRGSVQPARLVVVGTGTIAADVGARLARSRHVELLGYVDDDPVPGHPVLGNLDDLPRICRNHQVDRVVVAFSRSHPARATDILRSLLGTVAIDIVPRYFELTGWEATLEDLDGLAVISLDGGGPGRVGRLAKRTFDLLGASVGLLMVAPVLLAAVLAIKATSPGPALFRQGRIGRGRRRFDILKLRTMREPEPSAPPAPPCQAPGPLAQRPEIGCRVTPVGRVLRRFGIDELPQLINVLRGEMSLVGPRPFVPEECAALPAWVERRFDIRPGMTGLWQVCGQHHLRLDELCRLDCQYVTSWSFAADLRILARTPGRLWRGGGGELPR
jgi:exopolysaccharide biosynthesis polyprenyl glycosylphosphotransferase